MHRIRLLLAAVAVMLVVGVPSALALGDAPTVLAQAEEMDRSGPAVVVEEPAPAPEDEAWTFRFLIPTLVGATGLAIAAVVIGYGVRVRARYRVVE
jgi:hypothetical protein